MCCSGGISAVCIPHITKGVLLEGHGTSPYARGGVAGRRSSACSCVLFWCGGPCSLPQRTVVLGCSIGHALSRAGAARDLGAPGGDAGGQRLPGVPERAAGLVLRARRARGVPGRAQARGQRDHRGRRVAARRRLLRPRHLRHARHRAGALLACCRQRSMRLGAYGHGDLLDLVSSHGGNFTTPSSLPCSALCQLCKSGKHRARLVDAGSKRGLWPCAESAMQLRQPLFCHRLLVALLAVARPCSRHL